MAFPAYSELEGKTWNELSDDLKKKLLHEFGYTSTSNVPVPAFSQYQRDWLDGAFLVLSPKQKIKVDEINATRTDLHVGTVQTIDGRTVATAYALTDPPSYEVYYTELHNAPFAHLTAADFPVPELP